ncbi:MAG: MarR family winged helix-turn-helix transcriptional regulator [Actinomycetota bacterium]
MDDEREPASWEPEELQTWSAVATLLEWLPAALDGQMQRDSGLSHFEFGILFALDQAGERTLAMSELAGYANSSLSRLSRAVGRLERNGWVRRHPNPEDGRITLATLTDKGGEVVREALPGHVELVRRVVFGALGDAEARQLGETSRRIIEAIGSPNTWRPPT